MTNIKNIASVISIVLIAVGVVSTFAIAQDNSKENRVRIEKLEETVVKILISQERTETKQEIIKENVKEIKTDMKEILKEIRKL
jgi:coenzyme F420-reducing hydrogenase delta subunit